MAHTLAHSLDVGASLDRLRDVAMAQIVDANTSIDLFTARLSGVRALPTPSSIVITSTGQLAVADIRSLMRIG